MEVQSLITSRGIETVKAAASDPSPVSGLTHTFYRYPARFSPQFAKATIEAFSEPGDLILDPFMGGGTSLVEALATGRRAIGTDISSLAAFVTSAKTTLLSPKDKSELDAWVEFAHWRISLNHNNLPDHRFTPHDYERNLNSAETWRIRNSIRNGLQTFDRLTNKRQEQFARCVLMKTAQWALDGRKTFPTIPAFREKFLCFYDEMRRGEDELHRAVQKSGGHTISSATESVKCFHRSAVGLETTDLLDGEKPRLILTSPPYPGIHVLYHRWQVHGGKETPAPFLIANKLDGAGSSFYTMGDRKSQKLPKYFTEIGKAFSSLALVADHNTVMVQMVSFSKPEWQLPRYLETLETAGFAEIHPSHVDSCMQSRVHREVPRRKWHANFKGQTHGATEIVLFHRLSR